MSDREKEQVTSRPKREVFEEFMASDHALVHLDSRKQGVSVPQNLLGQHTVCLKMSYNFQGRTSYDDDGVTSFLKFDGHYFECVVPWNAVWGMSSADGKRYVWPTDLPKEILFDMAKTQVAQVISKVTKRKKKTKEAEPTSEASAPIDEAPSARPRPLLRRIK